MAMVAVGGPVSWWAFNKALLGYGFYNWIWIGALIVAIIGTLTIIAQIGKWMHS